MTEQSSVDRLAEKQTPSRIAKPAPVAKKAPASKPAAKK